MTAYSTQTVAQLKDILKDRGLSTAGVKSELVARLEESDNTPAAPDAPAKKEEELLEEVEEEELKKEEQPKEEVTEESKEEAKEDPKKESKEEDKPKTIKQLTPEERKAAAIDLLEKKIARAKKFGSEADVEEAQKDLARVQKFGVELGTGLAKEIGLASRESLDTRKPHRKNFRRGYPKGFRSRQRN